MKTTDLPTILEYAAATRWYVTGHPNITTRNEIEKIPRIWDFVYQQVDWCVSDHLWNLSR